MKATLTFNLPDDHVEHMYAVHASDFHSVLYDLDQEMRTILKYEDHPEGVYVVVERLREMLREGVYKTGIEF